MPKMTSAYANKMLRKLNDDKEFWLNKEVEGYMYEAALDEEPVIPDYDYNEVSEKITEIDEKVAKIKHAINVSNSSNTVTVGGTQVTVDTVLVRMAQLNKRKEFLDRMRKQQPKRRISSGRYSARNIVPEYQYINYDLNLIKKEYETIDARIAEMQLALDRYNQTVEFDVDI